MGVLGVSAARGAQCLCYYAAGVLGYVNAPGPGCVLFSTVGAIYFSLRNWQMPLCHQPPNQKRHKTVAAAVFSWWTSATSAVRLGSRAHPRYVVAPARLKPVITFRSHGGIARRAAAKFTSSNFAGALRLTSRTQGAGVLLSCCLRSPVPSPVQF